MTTAVLTGASRGIGRATALSLAGRHVDLALFGRPSNELSRTKALVEESGANAEIFECDVARVEATEAAARAALDRFGPPDAVIQNAAVIHRAKVVDTTTAAWDEHLAVNLRGPFVITRSLLPAMLAAKRGRIVHVGSVSSTLGTPEAAAYCASKWGLVGFMKSLAEELTDTGLMTVAVLPGSVDTRMLRGSGFPPRMTVDDVAKTLAHYALDAPLAHNGGVVEMFGA